MFEMYFVGQIRRFRCSGSDRLGKIERFVSKIEFRLFGTTDTNPADITTRLLSPNASVSCEVW